MKVCDIVFFNVAERVIQAAIDVICGEEIIFPVKQKNTLIWLLNKLQVKWSDEETPVEAEADVTERDAPSDVLASQPDHTKASGSTDFSTRPPNVKKRKHSQEKLSTVFEEPALEASKEDFYAILDTFTETSDEELNKIHHMLVGETGTPTRKYKCLRCEKSSKFFTQAERHHLEHEHASLSVVRETLKKAELERAIDSKNISKLEQGIGKIEDKKVIRSLRLINDNLTKHLEKLDALHKSSLPEHLLKKCKEFTKSLLETTSKADKVLNKVKK